MCIKVASDLAFNVSFNWIESEYLNSFQKYRNRAIFCTQILDRMKFFVTFVLTISSCVCFVQAQSITIPDTAAILLQICGSPARPSNQLINYDCPVYTFIEVYVGEFCFQLHAVVITFEACSNLARSMGANGIADKFDENVSVFKFWDDICPDTMNRISTGRKTACWNSFLFFVFLIKYF